jgi:hypothetical protein
MIGLDNYYGSPEMSDLPNEFEIDTIKSNREKTYKRQQGKNLKQGEMTVSFRIKMMTLK